MAVPPKPQQPAAPGMVQANTEQFDVARRRAGQQEDANLQAQKDALARRAAQTGGGVSGALIKQEGLAADASGRRLSDANEAINAQESGENARVAEINSGRQFQTSERLGAQEYGTSERLGSQGFASEMQGKQFAYGTKEREAGQTFQAGQQEKAITAQFKQQEAQIKAAAAEGKLNREQANAQLVQLQKQFDSEMEQNKNTNAINSILSAHNSGIPPQAMSDLLASLGIVFKNGVPEIPGVTTALPPPPPTVVYRDAPPAAGTDPGYGSMRDYG